ncbi:hypothetical protein AX774_g4298 [Zancudomyces culisetae]|uniref:Uncharacterized protein n=1 Tax=Zancudomyces culisetae TaxID=1213189 RepID=A0A1R1PK38_ZANCU|nr:hypothetical protein AX774_g5243 [Zancudomyces culisetae]OMH82227.1 hypothetical protein AX774_g4298 [Zancudomyces culisetae]|eukprot:OMH81299.1 hypothetical protein AX774_g5243 [Zancudomyces culisetae]
MISNSRKGNGGDVKDSNGSVEMNEDTRKRKEYEGTNLDVEVEVEKGESNGLVKRLKTGFMTFLQATIVGDGEMQKNRGRASIMW